ncbi:MAG TPA: type II secretion system F family protein [Fimbriimonadaceae bacterium]|nr:type II secretion system F family protein [Fimbriimonadaceae bacterium]
MPTFEYLAVNDAGERISGTVLGNSIEHALNALSQRGLVVERINQSALAMEPPLSAVGYLDSQPIPPPPVQPMEMPRSPYEQRSFHETPSIQAPPTGQRSYMATSVVGPLAGRVPLPSLSMFFRQFGTMLEAGVPIVQALDTLSRQGRNIKMHAVVSEIRGHVEAGRDISTGMQRYPEVFPPLSISLVRAGEEGGFVAQSFKMLADYTDKEIALRNLIRRLTLHPKIVLTVAIVVIGGASLLITMMGKDSSLLATPLTNWVVWMFLGPLLIAAFLFFRVGLANPRIKYNWDKMLIKMPLGVGKTVHEFAMSKFGMALSFLYKGGVPVGKAIQLSADACGNEYLRAQISPASRRLESGDRISDTLKQTDAFSPIVMDMVDTGERTGNLDQMLLRMSNFYEDEAETRAKQVANIFSVILFILVALYVAYVVFNFYQKLFAGSGAALDGD